MPWAGQRVGVWGWFKGAILGCWHRKSTLFRFRVHQVLYKNVRFSTCMPLRDVRETRIQPMHAFTWVNGTIPCSAMLAILSPLSLSFALRKLWSFNNLGSRDRLSVNGWSWIDYLRLYKLWLHRFRKFQQIEWWSPLPTQTEIQGKVIAH